MTTQERIAKAEEKVARATARRQRADDRACAATAALSDAEEAEWRAKHALRKLREELAA